MASRLPARRELIAAVATPPGRGGVGVVRVSGDATDLAPLIDALLARPLRPRHAHYGAFYDGAGGVLDTGIALWFPAPHSFTGESVLELQGHGGPVVLDLVLRRCLALGARPARPGEFSERAFLNGKIDLAQAEAVADLIDAASEDAARAAVASLSGVFSTRVRALVDELVQLRALVEATLDFPDEEIDFLQSARAVERLAALDGALADVQAAARQGALLRDGLKIVLIGQPNVGKSSLLNALAGYEAAIVTDIPGTTRDTVRESIRIEGVPVEVIDTAGLRETEDAVEKLGIARSWAAAEQAQVGLLLVDAQHGVGGAEMAILDRLRHLAMLTVHNKIDLSGELPRVDGSEVWLSARTGAGIDLLRAQIARLAGVAPAGGGVFMARARHLAALEAAARHIRAAHHHVGALELFAEELRLAQVALASITGEFSADDLLGRIFGEFCIGK